MDTPQTPTPGQAASTEAARQAVALAFGVASALVLIAIQRKWGLLSLADEADPSAAARRRMARAQRDASRWDRAARWLFTRGAFGAARAAHKRAEAAREAYEAERPC